MMRFALLCMTAGLIVMTAVGATAQPPPLNADPGFEQVTEDELGPWELRYAIKASDPATRPRWVAVPGTDPDDPQRGPHLSVEEFGPACGTLYVGQRLTLPETLPDLSLSVDFQTFCPMDDRSGSVALGIMLPEAWDAISADPLEATVPPGSDQWIMTHEIHRNRENRTEWTFGETPVQDVARQLEPHAGQEVVMVIGWSTWHDGHAEWARFDNFRLGQPLPRVVPVAWPTRSYRGEPLAVRVTAAGYDDFEVELRHRAEDAGEWESVAMNAEGAGFFHATVPAEAFDAAVVLQAAMRHRGYPEQVTALHTVRIAERPERPSLLYTAEELQRMREKAEEYDWAGSIRDGIIGSADAWLQRDDDPPAEQGGWSHDYVCPEDGARLQFRESHPHQHRCRSCDREWEGEKLDATWRSHMHGRFGSGAGNLALAYQLTGDERYARRAADIVLWYARNYHTFPHGRGPAGRGRVHSQSLTEATWLISIFQTADLIDDVFSPEERREVEHNLVRAGTEHISEYTFGIHNIQCWHNACMAIAGYYLGDPDLVARGEEGAIGFHRQVEEGILEDGMWYERSMGYHYYTLNALIAHIEAARRNDNPLHEHEGIRRMFLVALQLAQPNLVTPSLNDQGYTRGPINSDTLEVAAGWYDDEDALRALRELYEGHGRSRSHIRALQYGEALPDVGEYRPPGSIDLPGVGLAVLREGRGDSAVAAMLEYGEHGGGHGHPDKLQLILYGLGRTLMPDPGTTGYGVPLHREWYKTTPSHNTVTIGTRSQRATTGELLDMHVADGWSSATAGSTGAYPGWELERRLLLAEGVLVDEFSLQGEEPDTLDWFARAPGPLAVSLETAPVTETAPNATYGYLREMRGATTEQGWEAWWEVDGEGARLHLTFEAAPQTEVVTCLAPGVPGDDPWHTLRVRRSADETMFRVVYQMLKEGESPRPVSFEPDRVRVGEMDVLRTEVGLRR